jgi:hypothetical protein
MDEFRKALFMATCCTIASTVFAFSSSTQRTMIFIKSSLAVLTVLISTIIFPIVSPPRISFIVWTLRASSTATYCHNRGLRWARDVVRMSISREQLRFL